MAKAKKEAPKGKTKKGQVKRLSSEQAASSPSDNITQEETANKLTKVTVEHCKSWQVFKRRALEQVTLLSQYFNLEVESELVVATKRGSFEITLTRDDGEQVVVWTGVKRGPPRKLKFPDPKDLLDKAREFLNGGNKEEEEEVTEDEAVTEAAMKEEDEAVKEEEAVTEEDEAVNEEGKESLKIEEEPVKEE